MSIRKVKKYTARDKRKIRIRKKISGTAERPRLAIYRSLNHMYAQLIDDGENRTIGGASTKSKHLADQLKDIKGKVDKAKVVGMEIARIAQEKNITSVVFDRNGFIFHGRVKAVADGAREGGLQF